MPFTIFNLDNKNVLHFTIRTMVDQLLLDQIITNPPSSVSWNGRSSDGSEMANASYKYEILYINPCNTTCLSQEGTFSKIGAYVGGLSPSANTSLGVLTIDGLQNATFFDLKISQNNSLIRQISINNPANSIAWDGKNVNGDLVPNGTYAYEATVGNACETENLSGTFQKTQDVASSPFFFYQPLPKQLTLGECGFLLNPGQNYYEPPRPCCEAQANIVIENVVLSGNLEIIVLGSIQIGENVTITPGSTINFWAGTSIDGEENLDYDVSLGASYTLGIGSCEMRLENPQTGEYVKYTEASSLKKNIGTAFEITPNPSSGLFKLQSESKIDLSSINLYGADGKSVPFKLTSLSDKVIYIDASSNAAGFYFMSAKTDDNKRIEGKIMINYEYR